MTDTTAGEGVREASAYRDGLAHGFKLGLAGNEAEYDRQKAWRVAEIIEARTTLAAQPSAGAEGYEDGRPAGWSYWFDDGLGGRRNTVLNDPAPLAAKNPPKTHHGSPITDVRPFFYATPAQPDTGDVAALRNEDAKWLIDHLDGIKDMGHAGEGRVDWLERTSFNDRIRRILAALSKPNAQGAAG